MKRLHTKRTALPLLLTLLFVGLSAQASETAKELPVWDQDRPSPYYPPDGLQSPLRDDGLHVGGDAWIDTGYERRWQGLDSEPNEQFWLMQGRFMLDATATYSRNDFFVQAKGQLLARVDSLRFEDVSARDFIDTDDAWIRFGMWDTFDLQVGRFEGWTVYEKGEGLERDTLEDQGADEGADIYEVNYAFYRQDGFGQLAAHVYPFDWLRFEVKSVFGNEQNMNAWGVRLAGIADFDWLVLKAAGEYRKGEHQEDDGKQENEMRGGGGSVQFRLGAPTDRFRARFGLNAAYGIVDRIGPFGEVDETGSPDTLSLGGFANLGLWSAVLGLGYNHTIEYDRQREEEHAPPGHFVHQQAFFSVRHPVVLPQLMAKLVVAWARAEREPGVGDPHTNDMFSVRLRLYFTF